MIAEPAGSLAASLAIDAVTSADILRSIASRSAASAPNKGSITRGASTNPAQNRSGSWSARSQDNQEVTPGGRAAAQSASSTLLPAPADPTTTVSRWPAPAASRRCSAGLVIKVAGSAGGRNFASANRAPRTESSSLIVPSAICPRFPGPRPAPTIHFVPLPREDHGAGAGASPGPDYLARHFRPRDIQGRDTPPNSGSPSTG